MDKQTELLHQIDDKIDTYKTAILLLTDCKRLLFNVTVNESVPVKKAEYNQKLIEKQKEYNDLMLNFYFFQL